MLKLLTLSDTTSGESIQKLVVYHGAFERIFDIADAEGYYHGGPVVEDCLSLLENLIRENVSNQVKLCLCSCLRHELCYPNEKIS